MGSRPASTPVEVKVIRESALVRASCFVTVIAKVYLFFNIISSAPVALAPSCD